MFRTICTSVLASILFPVALVAQTNGASETASGVDDTSELLFGIRYSVSAKPVIGSLASIMLGNNLQAELGLTDDQIMELESIQRDFSASFAQVIRSRREGDKKPDERSSSTMLREIQETQQKRLKEVLLPHQHNRLSQIMLQAKIRSMGHGGAMADKEVAAALGLTEDQLTRLKSRSEEIQAEMEEEIAAAKEKAKNKLMKELTPEQRVKFEEMVGSEFNDAADSDRNARNTGSDGR